ncbi:tRNA-splicing endonuclease subunit sen54 N-term-domain-containing protein [Russula earlei]|uniref:tRNA-splicing endonuclease subunit sen54 N-term-domain-containing protein n=1 Tax=Russula earlei TaxID=71964 RepID=A0ACC0U2L3_9AGAM|nr:tRNA-splicing endonuclease subunit sen54 N-term-domain-containing protein [Russula earlei]
MDDTLEQPNPFSNSSAREEEDEQGSSGDEDGGLDWTKLPQGNSTARPIIPKRGEKDFEPAQGGGSGLQRHNLERARAAMFDAIRSTRAISSKSVSYAVWYPDLARAHVTVARGVHFTSMGHSVQRPSSRSSSSSGKPQKRLELLPEEALYLVEKGALFCWKASREGEGGDVEWDSASQGAPMSVQQAYAEMIGKQDLTLDRYLAFAYLRRLGYIVTRAKSPSPAYPVPAAYPISQKRSTASIFSRVLAALCSPFRRFLSWLIQPSTTWWRPLVHRRWLHHNMDYPSIFRTLRFFPSGHSVPLQSQPPRSIFYHLHKPNSPYRKTMPPPPDFAIVVVNARTTPIPTLAELTCMYEGLPVVPPPVPRKRRPSFEKQVPGPKYSPSQRARSEFSTIPPDWVVVAFPVQLLVVPRQMQHQSRLTLSWHSDKEISPSSSLLWMWAPVSFFRFGQGAFEEWPMA